jgi:hypothetical protein
MLVPRLYCPSTLLTHTTAIAKLHKDVRHGSIHALLVRVIPDATVQTVPMRDEGLVLLWGPGETRRTRGRGEAMEVAFDETTPLIRPITNLHPVRRVEVAVWTPVSLASVEPGLVGWDMTELEDDLADGLGPARPVRGIQAIGQFAVSLKTPITKAGAVGEAVAVRKTCDESVALSCRK